MIHRILSDREKLLPEAMFAYWYIIIYALLLVIDMMIGLRYDTGAVWYVMVHVLPWW